MSHVPIPGVNNIQNYGNDMYGGVPGLVQDGY